MTDRSTASASPALATRTREQRAEALSTAGQWQMMRIRFRRHRLAMAGATVVLLFYLLAAFAEFVAPYDPTARDMALVTVPPMRIRLIDAEGRLRAPFVYSLQKSRDPVTLALIYRVDPATRLPVRLFIRGDAYKLWGLWDGDIHFLGTPGPGRAYLLGGDEQGRDLLSRIIFGTRVSLSIGLIGVALSFGMGIVLGSISGYFGGIADIVVQRIIEVLVSIPSLPLWMALSAAIPLDWSVYRVFFVISIILSLLGWPGLAREVRGKLLALRGEDFVTAAKVAGCAERVIMFRHLVPSFLSHIIASGTLAIPWMILGETALSFLGIGLQPPAISWGVLLKAAQNVKAIVATPWLLIPGLFVVAMILSFNFLGDGLRDAADPYK